MDTDSLGWLLALIFYIICICGGLNLREEMKKIEEENIKLKKEKINLELKLNEYKWQIEQVPYIIENWCKGE